MFHLQTCWRRVCSRLLIVALKRSTLFVSFHTHIHTFTMAGNDAFQVQKPRSMTAGARNVVRTNDSASLWNCTLSPGMKTRDLFF